MNTNYGMSKEYQLTNRIMQGNTWACAKASAQVDSFEKEMLAEEPSFMYRYKEEVPLPLLGKVNNLFGVAEGGYKTIQGNYLVNFRTTDKELQFGHEKGKTMTVSKKANHSFQDSVLEVHALDLKHKSNGEMADNFIGKARNEHLKFLMYLRHVLPI